MQLGETSNEAEERAVEICYEQAEGRHVRFAEIPSDVRENYLQEIRARAAQMEQSLTRNILFKTLSERRRTPRRHMRVAFFVLLVATLVIGAILSFTEHQ